MLSLTEKKQILKSFKLNWGGCACDKCLMKLIDAVIKYLKIKKSFS